MFYFILQQRSCAKLNFVLLLSWKQNIDRCWQQKELPVAISLMTLFAEKQVHPSY